MVVTLPFEFDTMVMPRKILKGFVAGSGIMMLLAMVMFIKRGPLASLPFPLAAILFAWVARRYVATFAEIAKGTITQDAVVVVPSSFGFIRLPSPVGRHPLGNFKSVRVNYLGPNRNTGAYLFAQIYLVGAPGNIDVCVAHERDTTAKALAPGIAAAVKLPLEQVGLAPFDH